VCFRYAAEFDVLRNPAVAAVIIAVYVLVIGVGTLGSLLVFVSVISTRQMWTATNVFIANLALTDLVVCAFDLPLSLHYQVRSNQGQRSKVICPRLHACLSISRPRCALFQFAGSEFPE